MILQGWMPSNFSGACSRGCAWKRIFLISRVSSRGGRNVRDSSELFYKNYTACNYFIG
ncbi:hypothetical protein PUN28_008209 [Cardiocondyla obscurior]|uniref:Uncharacterized protein n=1 Tax=Cardiocondyla obscurior TaxID=286306 RepID=A0AAW2FZ62_9HYME